MTLFQIDSAVYGSRFVATVSHCTSIMKIRGSFPRSLAVRRVLGTRDIFGRRRAPGLILSNRRSPTRLSARISGSSPATRESALGPGDGIAQTDVARPSTLPPRPGPTEPAWFASVTILCTIAETSSHLFPLSVRIYPPVRTSRATFSSLLNRRRWLDRVVGETFVFSSKSPKLSLPVSGKFLRILVSLSRHASVGV